MTSWNAHLEGLLAGTLLTADAADPSLAWDWGDSQPFTLAVGTAECDNGTLVDTHREIATTARTVDATHLQEWIQVHRVAVLDLRSPEEYAEAHIPQARLASAEHLAEALATLQDVTTVVLVCRSGRRSGDLAHQWQHAEGWEIYHLTGGMATWNGPLA